ncbi:hypothetical protein PDE_08388 [Penicillium oxalicum 114-2]|uniref:Uncharacterized protein n=1 Tax=Penicillium oxalicum (strain 114-2 / CGMCC 5302) TaxID=933388 RepID=S7ZXE0_PENO1|nr:hypothetical protein PDE_08388 [Penicillium oxalicum 114-2]
MPGWSMERVQVVIEKFKLDVQGDRHEPDVCREAEKKKKKTSATDDLGDTNLGKTVAGVSVFAKKKVDTSTPAAHQSDLPLHVDTYGGGARWYIVDHRSTVDPHSMRLDIE